MFAVFAEFFLFKFFFCKEIILSLFDSDYFFVMWKNLKWKEKERQDLLEVFRFFVEV